MNNPLEIPAEPPIKKKILLKVFGLGGAGCNAAAFAAQSASNEVQFLAVNTDCQALELCPAPAKFVLGAGRTHGLGAGGDPDLGRAAAEDDVEKIRSFCAGPDIVFLLAGLGGGTGTGAAPVFARVARETGALVLALVTLPFDFEGQRRQLQAQNGLQQIKAAADAVICLPNQKLFELLDEKTSVVDAFKISNGLVAEGLRGIWRLLTQPGLVNVDFADLCSVTRDRHAASFFATAEASGDKRVEQVLEKLLAHPLLDGGQALNESESLLVSILGGPDLMMAEVNKLMEPLNRQCENAHVIFGAVIDQSLTGHLSVTLIASPQRQEPVPLPRNLSLDKVESLHLLNTAANERPASRFIAPPPDLSAEQKEQLMRGQTGRSRKKLSRLQKELPLEIVFKGRFEKSEPTIRRGEDLDVPTYIRRGVPLN